MYPRITWELVADSFRSAERTLGTADLGEVCLLRGTNNSVFVETPRIAALTF